MVPEIALHITQRGHNRRDCFLHDTDYLVYLSLLRDLSAQTCCELHAYCLMTNHVHLLLTPSNRLSCASLMRNLGQRYVQYFNKRYQRSGTLWEGRFRSSLVDSALYVVGCYRYIERNPVRARMVASPGDYAWSSYDGNSGRSPNAILTPHAEYLALGLDDAGRHAGYKALVAEEDSPAFLTAIRDATNGGFALVGDRLKAVLPESIAQRLERKPPGPRPKEESSGSHPAELQIELGLRPRTS